MVNPKRHKPVQALQRGLTMLEVLASKYEGVSLKELAETVGTSSPAAYHMVQTLVEAGYVRRVDQRYFLGPKVAELVRRHTQYHLREAVDQLMLRLARELPGVLLFYSEEVGEQVMVVRQIGAAQPKVVQSGHPHVLPPYVSSGGLVHLAYWPQETVDRFCDRYPFELYGLAFWRSREAFDQAVEALRRDRCFLMPESAPERLKLALPLLHPDGALIGAVTVQWNQPEGTPDLEILREKLVQTSRAAAEAFTQALK